MNTNEHESETDELVKRVIGAAYTVSNTLGCGFLEKVYQRSLALELAKQGLKAQPQAEFKVFYNGINVGDYVADLLVEEQIIVELKCVDNFANEHIAQCLNYLKAANLRIALLINFQKPKVQWKRIII